MKAFLLAAGLGTRLRPFTNSVPKCLIPINGQPLLDIWLHLLENEHVDEVLINTHYFPEKVEKFISKRNNKIKVQISFEEKLLGSGGTIISNKNFINGENDFYVLYADNLTNVSLRSLLDFHLARKSIFTTYVYKTDVPRQKGIFVTEPDTGKVLDFQEKPENPRTNLANAGIGVLNKEIFNYFDKNKIFFDFGSDIMPKIIHDMYILATDLYIKDIGTVDDYNTAQEQWKLIKSK